MRTEQLQAVKEYGGAGPSEEQFAKIEEQYGPIPPSAKRGFKRYIQRQARTGRVDSGITAKFLKSVTHNTRFANDPAYAAAHPKKSLGSIGDIFKDIGSHAGTMIKETAPIWMSALAGSAYAAGGAGAGTAAAGHGFGGGATGAMAYGGGGAAAAGAGGLGGISSVLGGGAGAGGSGVMGMLGGAGGGTSMMDLVGGGLSAYADYKGGKESQEAYERAFQTANPFAQYRGQFGAQLSKFMQDPSAITETPGYKFAMEQGTKAMGRTSAARGERMSGRALVEAQKFGSGLASQMRQQEISNLAMLSGATMGFGGGQYGAGAPGQYYGGIQQGLENIGGMFGYGR